ncbi:hypothetical protein acdb102_18440 [Acidothermaceae bacterium B102]|nr:hypothetical protein acdb102_18440 [Acidothermaceae bacterium B102]
MIAAVLLVVVAVVVAVGVTLGSGGGAKPAASSPPTPTPAASSATTSAALPSALTASATGTEPAAESVAASAFTGGASVTGLTVSSPDDAALALPQPRLVFSGVRGSPYPPAKSLTLTNTSGAAVSITHLQLAGPDPSSFRLTSGQPTSLTVPAGGSVTVPVLFHPKDPVGCPTTAQPLAIADVNHSALLSYETSAGSGSVVLAGVMSCYSGGNSEPTLDQLLAALGYSTVVDGPGVDRRFVGPLRFQRGTDEIAAPYLKAASSAPVSLVDLAHYEGGQTTPYGATGWYARGAAMSATSTCDAACHQLWQFPADPSLTTYNQNQKLMPRVVGTTTFQPGSDFGLYTGDGADVSFSDDSLNIGHTKSGADLAVPHYLHNMRFYIAYGPGHVAIPHTYLVTDDIRRAPSLKNNDDQDVVMLLRNVDPAVTAAAAPGTSTNLTAGGTVSATCAATGFSGVLTADKGTSCNAGNIAFSGKGLSLTSTAGQLANGDQQNALYQSFDATRGSFTITARVLGPFTQLTADYQQIAAFFGPDDKNFVKVETEHNGSGPPHLTMFFSQDGKSGTVGSVPLSALTTAHTLDLVIHGNTSVPDPIGGTADVDKVHGYPLDEVTAAYSIDGATPVPIGAMRSPADVTAWFSASAKAGILVSGAGSSTPFTATFSRFAISPG